MSSRRWVVNLFNVGRLDRAVTRIYKLPGGTSLTDEIARIARKEKIKAAVVDGIGTVNDVKLAFSEDATKKEQARKFKEQLEVTTLLGSVRLKGGKPFVHVHETFSRKDMSVVGGHIVSATVSPMFELMITLIKE